MYDCLSRLLFLTGYCLPSVHNIMISISNAANENLRKITLVPLIPYAIRLLTKIPVEPNIIPANIGNINIELFTKYLTFI